ncbi:hypothetical protein PoB_000785600 [Plakobranchus ocellatus]|uniref:Uncharacterized protein n=1 Tax=Plakobranchus ocellatus TaxID=259542 RepID=A0AAV3Y2B2_9GAST|nr:hypothetical protein PoB_000785600 [Plakobranchus ocellatus]
MTSLHRSRSARCTHDRRERLVLSEALREARSIATGDPGARPPSRLYSEEACLDRHTGPPWRGHLLRARTKDRLSKVLKISLGSGHQSLLMKRRIS